MEIRDKIIETAGKLFIEHGTRQVSMDFIAQELGISKRTIYKNFKDKNDLLKTFLTEAIIRHKKESIEIMKNSKNVIDALFSFGEFNQQALKSINPVFFDDLKKYHKEVYKIVMGDDQIKNYEVTYMILKRGINEGNFMKDIDIEIANLFIHYAMQFFHEMTSEKKFSHLNVWRSVHLPYLRGISTEKGQELITGFMNKYKNLSNN